MIPLSNPLDTRSVWLRTGSETEAGWGSASRHRKRKDEGKTREQICFSSLLLTENRRTGGSRDLHVFGWGRKRLKVENDAWANCCLSQKKEKLKTSCKRGKEGTFRKKWWRGGERAEIQIPVYSGSHGPESYYEMLLERQSVRVQSRHTSDGCLFAQTAPWRSVEVD